MRRPQRTFEEKSNLYVILGERFGCLPHQLYDLYNEDPFAFGFDITAIKLHDLQSGDENALKKRNVGEYSRRKRKQMEKTVSPYG